MSQPPEPRPTEEQPQGGHAPDEGAARPEPAVPASAAAATADDRPSTPEGVKDGAAPPSAGGEASEAPADGDGSGEGSAPAEASADGDASGEASAPVEASADGDASGEASAPAEGDAAEGAPAEGAGAEASAGDGSGQAAAPTEGEPKKKKRRRKRKKKPSAEGEGEESRPAAHVPFGAFFGGAEARRHAFSAGEIVAGRVVQVAHGVVLVDLFGKATAIVDVHEPHEVVPLPEPPAEEEDAAAQGTVAAPEGTEGDGPTAETPPGAAASPADAATEPSEASAPADAAPTPETGASGVASESPSVSEPGADAPAGEAPSVSDPAPATPADAPAVSAGSAEAVASDTPAVGDAPAPSAEAASNAGEASDDEAEAAPAPPDAPPPEPPPVGAIFRGRIASVAESGHVVIVNRAIDRPAAKAAVAQAREEKRRVHGVVYGFNRGGFDVLVEGLRAFCPASAMALEPIAEPNAFVGRKLEFTLPPSKGGGGIIVSRRGILEREGRKLARQRLKSIQPGHRMVGTVTDVRDFGAFVDLGEGLEGMVHVSELSWQRELKPSDVVKPGDEVVVRVLEVKPANRKERQGRVSLSIRAVEPDPWDEHAELLTPGAPRKGRIVRTTDFGAFIELAPGIDGLLHISELGRELKHASQALSEGDEIDVVIDRVDAKQRRISLSKLSPMEAQMVTSGELDISQRPRSMKPGSHITVLVERVDHGGVQVKVQGVLGRRGRGFIPNRELSGPQGGVDRKLLVAGHPLEVKIIGTDRDGGLRCSLKGRQLDEERRAVQNYRREASKQGLGTFGDLLRAKLGQEPPSGSS
jgi:small subunit ribosomal protein S1